MAKGRGGRKYEGHVGVLVHPQRRRDVEREQFLHAIRVVPCQARADARAAVVADHAELRVPEVRPAGVSGGRRREGGRRT
jgi:hypothetical protein